MYIALQVTNLSKKKIFLKASDNYPPQGFPIAMNVIAKIKKEVSRPSAVTFTVVEQETKKALFLNGKSRITLAPSNSALQVTKLTVTAEGVYTNTSSHFHFYFQYSCNIWYFCSFQNLFILLCLSPDSLPSYLIVCFSTYVTSYLVNLSICDCPPLYCFFTSSNKSLCKDSKEWSVFQLLGQVVPATPGGGGK